MPSGSVDDSVTGQGHPQSMGHEIPVTPEGHKLEVYFYEDVENAGAVRDALLEGRITECAMINPASVASTFHLAVAASTALLSASQGALNVKSLHAELVFCLSPTCNISESFRNFGSGKTDTKVLLAFIDTPPTEVAKAITMVKGRPVDAKAFLDAPIIGEKEAGLRKLFKIAPAEMHVENAVITRLAAKKYF